MTEKTKQRIWSKDFILIFGVGLMTSIGMQTLNATMSIYANSLGASATFSGLMATSFAVAAVIMRLVSGRYSDLRGRRLTMVIGAAIFAVAVYAFGIFAILPGLLIFRAVQGIGFSVVSTSAAAAIVDVTPKKQLGEGIGYYGLGISLAMAIGPAIGLPLASSGNFLTLYLIIGSLAVLGVIFSLFCTYEKRLHLFEREPAETGVDSTGIWKVIEKSAIPASITYLVCTLATSSVVAFLPPYAQKQGYDNIAMFFILGAAAMFIARLFTGRIYDRKGPLFVLIPSLLGSALSFALIAVVSGELAFLAIGILYGFTLGMTLPAFNALAVRHSPVHRRGAASATFNLCVDVGIGLGSFIWGLVIDGTGSFLWIFIGSAICMIVALAMSLLLFRKAQPSIEINLQ